MRAGADVWRYAYVDDVEIGYTDRGRGDAVFLVHAGVFSHWFRHVANRPDLKSFRVVNLRRAGYCRSAPPRHLTVGDHAHHAAALAEKLKIERIHWVGHSSSCQIGLALALEQPELVRSLILIEPAAAGEFRVPASEQLGQFFGQASAAFQAGLLTEAFDHFMRGVCGERYHEVLLNSLGKEGLDNAIAESAYFFKDEVPAVQEWNFDAAQAARIHQPVLCLEGGAQPAHLATMASQISERTAELLKQTRIQVLPGVNHAMPLQDPASVAWAIAQFVAQVAR